MRTRNKILLLGVGLIVLSIFYFMKEYSRTVANLADVPPQEKLVATELAKAYNENEMTAEKKYAGKIIEVTGVISSIYNEADTIVNVLLNIDDSLPKISCSMESSEIPAIKKYASHQSIIIKGYCTGYLLDVKMNRCVIIK
ncbi:MAG: hypothetical protein ABIP35_06470 [Ginsengibacter sp.]